MNEEAAEKLKIEVDAARAEDPRKPNRAERREGHRIFNKLLRDASKAALPPEPKAIEAQAKERRRVRHERIALESSKRRTSRATRQKNRRLGA